MVRVHRADWYPRTQSTHTRRQEFLLSLGISGDRSSAATIMIYSQVLWALAIDRIVWNVKMNIWTFVGIGGVVGSLILVSLAKEVPAFRGPTLQTCEAVPTCDDGGRTVYEIDLVDIYNAEEV